MVLLAIWSLLGLTCFCTVGYLLFLLGAAAIARRKSPVTASSSTTFAVIIPAHNEELVIEAMLASVSRLDYPHERLQVVVIADNCTDRTVEIARSCGAQVIERFNDVERGKGYALAEATRTLLSQRDCPEALVIIDADTFVAEDFLRVMSAAFQSAKPTDGRVALQGRYGVLNIQQGWRPALMAGAFDLFNHVKPLGREVLGLSAGLKGNGMVFSNALVAAAPFSGASITEDIDYGLDLLLHHGIRVRYVPHAVVKAQMPVTGAQAKSQRERWENGRFNLMRERVPALLAGALRRRDIRLADAAVDLLLPPLAEIALLLLAWAVVTVLMLATHTQFGSPAYYVAALGIGIVGFVIYILGGFKVAGAPREAYSALLRAPGYAVWKLATRGVRPFTRRHQSKSAPAGTDEWVRTERVRMSTPDGNHAP